MAALCIFLIACDEIESPHKAKFDKLEKVFGNAHWQALRNKDTMYAFFKREGDALYKVYTYHVKNGDSIQYRPVTIYANKNGIVWYNEGDDDYQYLLENADDTMNLWNSGSEAAPGLILQFTTKDAGLIAVNYRDGFCGFRWDFPMVRMMPIDTFLARSKYDFLHGTSTAHEAGSY